MGTMIALRLEEMTATDFRSFCKEFGLTQSQGLQALVTDCRNKSTDGTVRELLANLKRTAKENEKLQERIEALQGRNEKNEQRHQKHDVQRKKADAARREMLKICQQFSEANDAHHEQPPLPKFSFKQAKAAYPRMWSDFSFPEKSGATIFYPWNKAYGHAQPMVFIFGHTLDGNPIKLRYNRYADTELGVSLWHQDCYRDQAWVVAYVTATDGAMDLVDAMLLPAVIAEVKQSKEITPTPLSPPEAGAAETVTETPKRFEDLLFNAKKRTPLK